jgi:hypothetical protein
VQDIAVQRQMAAVQSVIMTKHIPPKHRTLQTGVARDWMVGLAGLKLTTKRL